MSGVSHDTVASIGHETRNLGYITICKILQGLSISHSAFQTIVDQKLKELTA